MSQVALPQQQKPSNISVPLEGHLELMKLRLLDLMHQGVWSHERICDLWSSKMSYGEFYHADPAVWHVVSLACRQAAAHQIQ